MKKVLLFLFLFPLLSLAQNKQITLEDIYKKGTLRGGPGPGLASAGDSSLFDAKEIKDETGKNISSSDYEVSADKKRILFFNGREPIYRRSSKSTVYVYDVATKKTLPLNKGKVLHPSFSPDGKKVAYVFDNNLYLFDVASGKTTAVTTDGKWNKIINGNSDWVYEEEFSFSQAFQWSPDGAYLAYYKFDESRVKEYSFTFYNDEHNREYSYKYPKAGDSNSTVTIHVYNVATGKTVPARYEQGDIYIPRIRWTTTGNKLIVYWMNRHQDDLKLLLTDPATGSASTLYEEKDKRYVDIDGQDDWHFLKNGKQFLFRSEMNGWSRIYSLGMDGKNLTELTKTGYDITGIEGIDEGAGLVYYSAAYPTPMDRNLFVTDFAGKKSTQLTTGTGWHRIEMNGDNTKFYDTYSNINTPQTVTLYDLKNNNGSVTASTNKVVNESAKLKSVLNQYALGKSEFIRVPNSKGDTLNGWMLKPANFDPAKKYPVLFCNYGGAKGF